MAGRIGRTGGNRCGGVDGYGGGAEGEGGDEKGERGGYMSRGGELAFRYGNMERLEAKTRPIFFFICSTSVKQQRNLTIPEKECDD